jgi:hypothetical protein
VAHAAPLFLLVAAPPDAPGVGALLEEAEREARSGAAVRVIFTDEGLGLLSGPWPPRLAAVGVRATLCARSARARRVEPAGVPPTVLWSSLTTFLGDVPPSGRLWSAFP